VPVAPFGYDSRADIDGRVTLRGPVNTAEGKRLIGEIADRIARSENVDNQLEVKFTAGSNN
jgi:osmotically-inducible protein OsmY